jgi:hypothetical protein
MNSAAHAQIAKVFFRFSFSHLLLIIVTVLFLSNCVYGSVISVFLTGEEAGSRESQYQHHGELPLSLQHTDQNSSDLLQAFEGKQVLNYDEDDESHEGDETSDDRESDEESVERRVEERDDESDENTDEVCEVKSNLLPLFHLFLLLFIYVLLFDLVQTVNTEFFNHFL